jgi:uncharacterized repeat protein (TIGR03803 family)
MFRLKALAFIAFTLAALVSPAFAAKEKVLHTFGETAADGTNPNPVISDASGNLYGSTFGGGTAFVGAVFELMLDPDGKWSEKVLYSLCSQKDCLGGAAPEGTMALDAAGNLYGTTTQNEIQPGGSAFQLAPQADGSWKFTQLHKFAGKNGDGSWASGALVTDSQGNLYGTTQVGGIYNKTCPTGCGIVFQLKPGADGRWNERVVHRFNQKDGFQPVGGLSIDAAGNLYGTALYGGGGPCQPYGCGTVFELTPGANDAWTFKTLHVFNGKDGYIAFAPPIMGIDGTLYGSTADGGLDGCQPDELMGCGLVYQLVPDNQGNWTERVLRYFYEPDKSDGSGVVMDAAGNLYGTTYYGGPFDGGTAYELSPGSNGAWVISWLHSFGGVSDGKWPVGVIVGPDGDLYGSTVAGGSLGEGLLFQIVP